MRNLRKISLLQSIIWALLALSSVPLHLLCSPYVIVGFCEYTYVSSRFNSAVFTTIAALDFRSWVVAEDFFDPGIFPDKQEYPSLAEVQSWDTKKPGQCLSDYRPNIITGSRNVYIVVLGKTTNKSSPVIDEAGSYTEQRSTNVDCTARGAGVLTSSCGVDTL